MNLLHRIVETSLTKLKIIWERQEKCCFSEITDSQDSHQIEDIIINYSVEYNMTVMCHSEKEIKGKGNNGGDLYYNRRHLSLHLWHYPHPTPVCSSVLHKNYL